MVALWRKQLSPHSLIQELRAKLEGREGAEEMDVEGGLLQADCTAITDVVTVLAEKAHKVLNPGYPKVPCLA